MEDPGAVFNLRKFPPDQRERFVNAVTRGKNQMPPWGISSSRISSRPYGPMSRRESGDLLVAPAPRAATRTPRRRKA
jgi:hypothetical protein